MATKLKSVLGKAAVKLIEDAVEKLYDRLKQRVLGGWYQPKRIKLQHNIDLTLPALFNTASQEERNKPDSDLLDSLMRMANAYLDAQHAATKAQTVSAVDMFLRNAHAKGVKTDVKTVLGGQLADIMAKAKYGVRRIVDTEATTVRNTGTLDGVIKVNNAHGIEDPLVYFVVVRDEHLCKECARLHLLPSGKPRVWHLSQLSHGFHKKGEDFPSVGGLHPNCRCSLVTLLPNYGFDESGMITYIGNGHDEYAAQND